MVATLTKAERLCGKAAVERLIGSGRWGSAGPLRYCLLAGTGPEVDRILLSVPKKLFKRAVKRNLLKRRLREAYRTRKSLLGDSGRLHADLLLQYNTKEMLSSVQILEAVERVLTDAAPQLSK